jgi:hypothetical protein
MKPVVVWFNKYLSNTWEILALLRELRGPEEFRLLCTDPRQHYPGFLHADWWEQEPSGLDEEKYLEYCLEVIQRFQVNLFFPGRKLLPILRAKDRFENLGVKILATGNAPTVALLNSKSQVYQEAAGYHIGVPDFEIVHDLAGFDVAYAKLRQRHEILCIKPDVSVYGLGFHIVMDSAPSRKLGQPSNPVFLELAEVRRRLGQDKTFRAKLVMEYLPGPERSVDCLAREGELLRCVVRRKQKGGQVLEDNPAIVTAVRELTACLGLTYLFNVQFRDRQGKSFLLEINPRMSGGLPFSCQSGLVLPLWAIRLALGTAQPEEIPQPRTGLWIPQPEPVSSL